jgi:hypothetical protein
VGGADALLAWVALAFFCSFLLASPVNLFGKGVSFFRGEIAALPTVTMSLNGTQVNDFESQTTTLWREL